MREGWLINISTDFQPEAAFAIFNRTLNGFDVATGEISTVGNSTHTTEGTAKTVHSRKMVQVDCPPPQ